MEIAKEGSAGGIYRVENVCGCAKHIKGRFSRSKEVQMGVGWQVAGMMELSSSGICIVASICKHYDVTDPTSDSISLGISGLSDVQKETLRALGAIEDISVPLMASLPFS